MQAMLTMKRIDIAVVERRRRASPSAEGWAPAPLHANAGANSPLGSGCGFMTRALTPSDPAAHRSGRRPGCPRRPPGSWPRASWPARSPRRGCRRRRRAASAVAHRPAGSSSTPPRSTPLGQDVVGAAGAHVHRAVREPEDLLVERESPGGSRRRCDREAAPATAEVSSAVRSPDVGRRPGSPTAGPSCARSGTPRASRDAPACPVTSSGTELHTSDPTRLSRSTRRSSVLSPRDGHGPGGTYHILSQRGSTARCDELPAGRCATAWLPYVFVDNPDAAIARPGSSGHDPGGRRGHPGRRPLRVLQDPTGAVARVMKPQPEPRGRVAPAFA